MADGQEHFYRHSTIIVDHTKDCFADLLEFYLTSQGITLHQFIQKYQHEIYHLCYDVYPCCMCPSGTSKKSRRNRVLYPSQLAALLDTNGGKLPGHNPRSRSSPNCCCPVNANLKLKDLDITLMRVLLVNFTTIVPCGSAVRNALEDLVIIRNKSYAHAVKGRMSLCEYETSRKEIEKHLLVIATKCGKETETRQKLIDASKQPLNDGICRQYQNALLIQAERVETSEKHLKRAADSIVSIGKALGTKKRRTTSTVSSMSDITCIEGRDAHFKSDGTDENTTSRWFKDRVEIFNTEKYVITNRNNNHHLEIANVEPNDSGSYSINVNGSTVAASLTVEAYFTKRLRDQNCIEGENIQFVCEVIEDNVPSKWFKDGKEIKESGCVSLSTTGKLHSLSILNAKTSDEGEYSITVQNRTRKANLQIKAYFLKALNDFKCQEDDDVTFLCKTIQDGLTGKWFRNESEIVQSQKHVVTNSGQCFQLKILNVTADDQGVYSLQIDGKTTTAKLYVKAQHSGELGGVEQRQHFKDILSVRSCFSDEGDDQANVFKEPSYVSGNKKMEFFEKTEDRYKLGNIESPQAYRYGPPSNKSCMADSGISDIFSPYQDSCFPASVASFSSAASPYNDYDANISDQRSPKPTTKVYNQHDCCAHGDKKDSISGREDELYDVYTVIRKEILKEENLNPTNYATDTCDYSTKFAMYQTSNTTSLRQASPESIQHSCSEFVDLKPMTETENYFNQRQQIADWYPNFQNEQVMFNFPQEDRYRFSGNGNVDFLNQLQRENSDFYGQVMNQGAQLRAATKKIQQIERENKELKILLHNKQMVINNLERKFEMVKHVLLLQWPWNN